MNIAFAKIGKSIKFKSAFSPIGGDNEAPNVFRALVNHNPDKTFYLVGRSDYKKLNSSEVIEMFPYGNVVDCYSDPKMLKPMTNPHCVVDYFNRHDIKIDFGIMMIGQIGTVTIPNKIEQVKHRELTAAVIDMTKNYSTPVTYWLNDSMVDYLEIVNDPRYTIAQPRDIFNCPKRSIGQFTYEYHHNKIESYEKQDRVPIDILSTYAGMEKAFLIGRDLPDITNAKPKTRTFGMVLNEGAKSRFPELKKWVLDSFDDTFIIGKWDDKIIENEKIKNPTQPRFLGTKPLEEAQKIMADCKYTFIIPIAPGWVTSKYIEMIHAGCIPFFHPDYDTQDHIGIPRFLKVKTPRELLERIEILENEPHKYNILLKSLSTQLTSDLYDGSFINLAIMGNAYDMQGDIYSPPDVTTYKKEEVFDLFSF